MATMTVYENTETRVILNVNFTDPTNSRRFSIFRSGASAPLSTGWMDASENIRIPLAVPDKLMYNTTYTLEARFDDTDSTFATCTFTTKHEDGSGGTDPDPDPNPPSGDTPWNGQDPGIENDNPYARCQKITNISVIYSGNQAYLRFNLDTYWFSPMNWPVHGKFTFTITFPDGSTKEYKYPSESASQDWVLVSTERAGCENNTKASVTVGDYYIGQKGALPANKILPIKVVANSFAYWYNGAHGGGQDLDYHWDMEVDYRKAARPEKFYWKASHANITKGETVANVITAAKWIELQNNVNAVREVVGTGANASPISFSAPKSGTVITADMYNKVARGINDVGGNIPLVSQYGIMTSTSMMNLQNTINSIG